MKDVGLLRDEYLNLLDCEHSEQVYQSLLEENSRLIPREFVQNHGLHLSLVLRKLQLGADYKSDFFYFSKSSDDWNAIHVEIEKPQSKFFRGNTNELHSDFKTALHQIKKWEAWFSRDNQHNFLSALSAVQVPIEMAQNPTHNKYVLVFGRRKEYAENQIRRSIIASYESENFKIISFDSLVEDLKNKNDLYIGSRHNEYVDLLTDEIIDPNLFVWMEPTHLRVSRTLQAKLAEDPYPNFRAPGDGLGGTGACKNAANKVQVRSD